MHLKKLRLHIQNSLNVYKHFVMKYLKGISTAYQVFIQDKVEDEAVD